MFYIIGLGNPGEKYKKTRHNIAWLIFDELFPDGWSHNKYMNAEVHAGTYGLYIKPQTFMNKSGEVISFLKKEIDFKPEHIIVVYDDIDLAFGNIRISYDRGDGGHNGLKSVVEHLGSKKCIRIRIGISKKIEDGTLVKPNVLGIISETEQSLIHNTITHSVDRILQSITEEGLEVAMNRYNT